MYRNDQTLTARRPSQRVNQPPTENDPLNGQRPGANRLPPTISEQFKESWLTAIIGSILFATGMCLLFWNEGRAASVARSLDEALENVAIIADPRKIPSEYEGKLVHLSGPIWVSEPLTEPDYGVVVESIKLKRRVQVYQWVEIEEETSYGDDMDKDKHYYYTTEWRDKLINSDTFYIRTGHENPKNVGIKSQVQIADEVGIGEIKLGMELKKTFNDFIQITSDQRPERRDIKMHSGLYYHSADLWNPRVGDLRILFSYSGKAGEVYSIVGKLEKGVIVPYKTSRGEEILLQRKSRLTVDRMFHLEHVHNYWRTWMIRGVGWLVLFIAASCLANILTTIILNSSFLCGIIAVDSLTMSVSMSLSLLVIGFAWVWYRPIVALILAFASAVPFLYSTFFSCNNRQNQQREQYRRF